MPTLLDGNQILQGAYDEPNQAIQVENIGNFIKSPWDYLSVAYPLATQEVYTFYLGGPSGDIVSIVTVNYTDASKENLLNVTKIS